MKYIPVCVLVVLLLGAVHAQDGKEPLSAAVEIRVTKAVSGSDGKAPTPVPADADKKSAGPSQQPAIASPPKRNVPSSAEANPRFAAPNAAWQQTATPAGFNPLSNLRVLSPLCPSGTEATACASFSGNTAVVVSSVMPAIGTNTNVKTTQCFCDFRNTVNAFLPANGNEVYRCAAYCQ